MSEKICQGKIENKAIIEKFEAWLRKNGHREDKIKENEQYFKTDFTFEDGEPIYMFAEPGGEKTKEYELLVELLAHISFEQEQSEKVYEIPGIKIPKELDNKTSIEFTNMYITKESAIKLAKKSTEIKKIFGIEFPDELYQLSWDSKIPSVSDWRAPEPRKFSETEEEYEARIDNHYAALNAKGVSGCERTALGEYRTPYIHEQIRYTNDGCDYDPEYRRESYNKRLQNKSISPDIAEQGGPGVKEGERHKVVDTDNRLGSKLRNALLAIEGLRRSPGTVKKAIALAGAGVLVGAAVLSSPASSAAFAVTMGIAVPLGIAGGGLLKKWPKAKAKLKKKWNDWLRGPSKEEPEHTVEQGEPQPEKTQTPKPKQPQGKGTPSPQPQGRETKSEPTEIPSEEINVPDELVNILDDVKFESEAIAVLDAQIEAAKISLADETDPERIAELEAIISSANQNKRQHLVNTFKMLESFIYNKDISMEEPSTGGPRL